MEIWSNIIIPIITSILGGLIGGLFTFLGVKLTLKDEKKRHDEQLELNIIEKNKEIIKNRPILQCIGNCESTPSMQTIVYLVPFGEPELINKKDIIFHYPKKFEEKQNWKEYSIYLKNIGNKRITRSFLHFEDLKNVNLYSGLDNWNDPLYRQHYFSDALTLSGHIAPGEILELKIYYLKDLPNYKNVLFDIYFEDENGNNWVQYYISKKSNKIYVKFTDSDKQILLNEANKDILLDMTRTVNDKFESNPEKYQLYKYKEEQKQKEQEEITEEETDDIFDVDEDTSEIGIKETVETTTDIVFDKTIFSIDNTTLVRCYGKKLKSSYDIPNGVTEIADNAFADNADVYNLTIPETVTKIGNNAFKDCVKLRDLVLPGSIKEIGSHAFDGCENLETIFCNTKAVKKLLVDLPKHIEIVCLEF